MVRRLKQAWPDARVTILARTGPMAEVFRRLREVEEVVVTGKGIKKTVRTGKDGKARITITPKQAGILTIRVPQTIVCGARRIGVVGAFEPPVTG